MSRVSCSTLLEHVSRAADPISGEGEPWNRFRAGHPLDDAPYRLPTPEVQLDPPMGGRRGEGAIWLCTYHRCSHTVRLHLAPPPPVSLSRKANPTPGDPGRWGRLLIPSRRLIRRGESGCRKTRHREGKSYLIVGSRIPGIPLMGFPLAPGASTTLQSAHRPRQLVTVHGCGCW